MHRFVAVLESLALSLGGPGMLLATFCDSLIPFPFIADGLIVTNVIEHPAWWLYYAGMATLGSVAGCFVLYSLARAGGHAFVSARVHARHMDRGMAAVRRWGWLTVLVPAILPPPLPFKPFVLFAGIADVSPATFILAVLLGRGFRYGAEALLAYWYGAAAVGFIHDNLRPMSVGLALVVVAGGAIAAIRRRRRQPA